MLQPTAEQLRIAKIIDRPDDELTEKVKEVIVEVFFSLNSILNLINVI